MKALFSQYFFPMENIIKEYSWGNRTSISKLIGINNPEQKNQAELWMGAHSNGCSKIKLNNTMTLLSDFIQKDKIAILSKKTTETFTGLPYLFKVLAVETALSIQVHPNKNQAEIGFKKEQEAGISITSEDRNYRDSNHKPELVYALTPYLAMNGFKEFNEIITLFKKLSIPLIQTLVDAFMTEVNSTGLKHFFTDLFSIKGKIKKQVIQKLLKYSNEHKSESLFALILDLSKQYPNDTGLFAPLILNVITLQPGEAMFLYACTPHAYIKGTGLEIMANSDNVLRAGLTPKHIDVEELVSCTNFETTPLSTLKFTPENKDGGIYYPVPVNDFKLSIFESVNEMIIHMQSAEILLVLDTAATLTHQSGEIIKVNKGASLFIPAYVKQYQLTCVGRVARAFN
jgi:mannose-6-phosphate isomerase